MWSWLRFLGLSWLLALGGLGCSRNLGALIQTGPDDAGERAIGVYPCAEGRPDAALLDPSAPLTLLVHGCTSSGARFRTLAEAFEARGQQTLCFNYNDRDFINTSATQLALALSTLERHMEPHTITVIAHSQGGLVARRAFQEDLTRPLITQPGFDYRLVTVSAPFSGIASSSDCSEVWLHVISLSITVGVCMAIAGNKWLEIPPGSRLLTNPSPLVPEVHSHLQIVTDERGACRRRREDGSCEEDDFVFSLAEQYADVVTSDARVATIEIAAGHAAVVGEDGEVPLPLLGALESAGVLAPVPPERREEIMTRLELAYAR